MKSKANFIIILLSCAACYGLLPNTTNETFGKQLISIEDIDGTEIGIYDESHALVIGGSDYTGGWPKLPGVEKDIVLVKDALEAQGFNVVVVRNPTSHELENAFEGFIEKHGYRSNSRLLFYFAGHGHTVKPQYGGEELGYIVPVEAPNPYDDLKKFRRVAMSMQRIEEYALGIDAKHALFVFDSCFSGSLFALSRAVPEHINYKTAKPVRQFITSGGADEKVPDTSIFRQQFIYALEGEGDLNGDGYMTASELGGFIFKNVVNYSKGAQHPQYGKIRNPNLDKGDFVFRVAQLESKKTDVSDSSSLIESERQQLAEEKERIERERRELEQFKLLALQRQELEAERANIESQKNKFEPEPLPDIETKPLQDEQVEKSAEENKSELELLNEVEKLNLQLANEKLKLQLANIGKQETKEIPETKNINEIARDGNFIAYRDGTILDTDRNLMWWSESMEEEEWTLAKYKAHNFRGGGFSDWRLPSTAGLKTIYDRHRENKFKSIKFIKLVTSNVFTSEMSVNSDPRGGNYVNYINFKSGAVDDFSLEDNYAGRMSFVPVRVHY